MVEDNASSGFAPIAQHYDGPSAEERFAREWEEAGWAAGDPARPGKPFAMVIPPPNVTGALHMGHALNNTLQDVLLRYRRMDGDNTVWIPGFDHASIAVHWLVERDLQKEGKSRKDIGREAFLERAWALKEQSQANITAQQKRLGLSCDWQRERFTLDETCSRAVREAFVTLYEDGLIYRAKRLVNWDPVSQTSVSDLEVIYEENVSQDLYHFAYKLEDGDEELVVATTRPETMLGDTAVAVHPDDTRYKHLIGKRLAHPFSKRTIPIIADAALVDMAFGTGAVKITPAHDFNDFAVAERHNLELINLLNPDGTLNEAAGKFEGLNVKQGRKAVVEELDAKGFGRGSQPHKLSLGRSERSGAVLEPMLSPQWYIRAKPLARPALEAVRRGFARFVPDGWQNTYNAWLTEIRDWCISRQLWWGHQIPAWTCNKCQKLHVLHQAPNACSACEHTELTQDPDVLDTWFSSALWPFSTQGWPQATPELKRWYPTQVLVTGFDIIFFWVARMMMMGEYFLGQAPFPDIYIHGLVRDSRGEKMSKTKGNVVDPLVMVDKYGCDAFRLALVGAAGVGRDIRWDESRVQSAQRFINKLWQAWRFVAQFVPDEGSVPPPLQNVELKRFDRWILGRLDASIVEIRSALDNYRFNDAANRLITFVWDELCDWYLEAAKVILYDEHAHASASAAPKRVLLHVLGVVSKLLQPMAPFLSETLYSQLKERDPKGQSEELHAMVSSFPTSMRASLDTVAIESTRQANLVAEFVVGVRRMRSDFNVPVKERVRVLVRTDDETFATLAEESRTIMALARCELERLEDTMSVPEKSATCVIAPHELFLPLGGLIDIALERKRLEKELARAQGDADKVAAQLGREDFIARAPKDIIADKQRQKDVALQKAERLKAALSRIA